MAYDHALAERIRETIGPGLLLDEREMFGGICFLVNGNMACGVIGDGLIARVGAEAYDSALDRPAAAPFDFTGKPMRGWVVVAPEGIAEDDDLAAWVGDAIEYAGSLPPK